MKRVAAGALIALGVSSVAGAGQVYGTLRHNERPLVSAPVTLTCGAEARSGQTDSDGMYRLMVSTTGNCTLVLTDRQARGTLYSYDRPTGYDFDVVQQSDGSWSLVPRRR